MKTDLVRVVLARYTSTEEQTASPWSKETSSNTMARQMFYEVQLVLELRDGNELFVCFHLPDGRIDEINATRLFASTADGAAHLPSLTIYENRPRLGLRVFDSKYGRFRQIQLKFKSDAEYNLAVSVLQMHLEKARNNSTAAETYKQWSQKKQVIENVCKPPHVQDVEVVASSCDTTCYNMTPQDEAAVNSALHELDSFPFLTQTQEEPDKSQNIQIVRDLSSSSSSSGGGGPVYPNQHPRSSSSSSSSQTSEYASAASSYYKPAASALYPIATSYSLTPSATVAKSVEADILQLCRDPEVWNLCHILDKHWSQLKSQLPI